MSRKTWTLEQTALLILTFPTGIDAAMGALPEYSEVQIRRKAQKLGLKIRPECQNTTQRLEKIIAANKARAKKAPTRGPRAGDVLKVTEELVRDCVYRPWGIAQPWPWR